MSDLLFAPLGYAFVVRALLAVTMVAAVCSLVGTFAVLRGMSYIGAALAHSLVPGVAVGYLVSGLSRDRLFWWATGTAIVTALGMSALVRRFRIGEDAAVGVVYSGMFALGIAIISTVRSFAVDLVHFLFGNVLSVSGTDLLRIGAVAAIIVIVVALFYKEMVLVTFDRVFAASLRLNSGCLTALQYVLMGLAIAVALQTIGIALVVTLMVAPAAAALQVVRRFHHAVLVAAAIGVGSGVVGLYLSCHLSVASGAAIAVVCVVVFLIISALARVMRAAPAEEAHGTADPTA
ncbi:MAG: metal ABC transporter permease [Spirochaetaceae bacterium]|nr:metal ABC transporter permease [Spirochaetaceae bacterium]